MSDIGLYRHVCSNCGEVVISDEFDVSECPSCDDEYSPMVMKAAPDHDKKIMEAPPENCKCPDCGSQLFALATERGDDWMCRVSGGCGFAGWIQKNNDIRPPEDYSTEEAARYNAWSRYNRYKEGHFEYRE